MDGNDSIDTQHSLPSSYAAYFFLPILRYHTRVLLLLLQQTLILQNLHMGGFSGPLPTLVMIRNTFLSSFLFCMFSLIIKIRNSLFAFTSLNSRQLIQPVLFYFLSLPPSFLDELIDICPAFFMLKSCPHFFFFFLPYAVTGSCQIKEARKCS